MEKRDFMNGNNNINIDELLSRGKKLREAMSRALEDPLPGILVQKVTDCCLNHY